jgi:hypothetical protein
MDDVTKLGILHDDVLDALDALDAMYDGGIRWSIVPPCPYWQAMTGGNGPPTVGLRS